MLHRTWCLDVEMPDSTMKHLETPESTMIDLEIHESIMKDLETPESEEGRNYLS